MSRRDIRRLALQALYQVDLLASAAQKPVEASEVTETETEATLNPVDVGELDFASLQHDIASALRDAHLKQDEHDPEMPELSSIEAISHLDEKSQQDILNLWCDQAAEIACLVWQLKPEIDPTLTELADEWPLHRQPPLDRSIMRLCGFEMLTDYAPMPIPIHEAVELAKEFCQENSANFVNAVLDGMANKFKASDLLGSQKSKLPMHLSHTETSSSLKVQPDQPAENEAWLTDALED